MVNKIKIYTKKGDNGTSALFNGKRLSKADVSFELLGQIDELNCVLGIVSTSKSKKLKTEVQKIQNQLFEIGSKIAMQKVDENFGKVCAAWVVYMEGAIDALEKKNKPLKNFILPGGSIESANIHLARAVCRRVERVLILFYLKTAALYASDLQVYFNRLSDLLFALARYYNKKGSSDVLWEGSHKLKLSHL